jgi:hypothetical protein
MQDIQGPFSDAFTGLDLSKSSGAVDPGMALVMHNCKVDEGGAVTRRGGTALLGVSTFADPFDPAVKSSTVATTVRTNLGNSYCVYILGETSIAIQRVVLEPNTDRRQLSNVAIIKSGVFKRPPTKVCFVSLTAPYDRLLIFSENNPPIQVSFLERRTTLTITSVAGSVKTLEAPRTSTDAQLWQHTAGANSGMLLALGKEYAFTGCGFSANGVTGTVLDSLSELGALSATLSGTLVKLTWQWCGEAEQLIGGNFTQRVTRANATKADQNVLIPRELTTEYDPISFAFADSGLLVGTNEGGFPAGLSLSAKPITNTEYQLTSGGRYDYNATTGDTPVNPVFCTFGDILPGGLSTSITFVRSRLTRLNRGRPLLPADLLLYVNNIRSARSLTNDTSPNARDYFLFRVVYVAGNRIYEDPSTAPFTGNYIRFTASKKALAFNDEVLILNTDLTWVGTGGKKFAVFDTSNTDFDGTIEPFPGIGSFCDYNAGVFPFVATIYRDRLAISSVASKSQQIALSAVSDQLSPGRMFSFFQIDENLQDTPVDPFTVSLPLDAPESITAMISWQNSLIVFSNLRTYAVTGGEVFGPSSYDTSVISSYGAFNERCVSVSDLTLLFLNSYGLFELGTKQSARDYGAVERSSRVSSVFARAKNLIANASVHWLYVDYNTTEAYIGLATEQNSLHTDVHLSLKVSSDSWSTLSSAVEFKLFGMFSADGDTWSFCRIFNNTNFGLLGFNRKYHLDYLRTEPNVVTFMPPLTPSLETAPDGKVVTKYPLLPGIEDIEITNATKKFDTYYRFGGAVSAAFARMPLTPTGSGRVLPIIVVPPTGTALLTPTVVYTPSGVTVNQFNLSDGLGAVNRGVGVNFISIWSSPMFDLESMGRLKRLKRLHLKFDPTISSEVQYPQNLNVFTLANAGVVLSSNYNDTPNTQLLATYPLPASNLERGVTALSVPLQGMGCDYQFHVYSVGAAPFRLTQYEFDIQPQRSKRFNRS